MKVVQSYSVMGNIDRIALSGKQIIFTCGSSDPFYLLNNEFMKLCDERKIGATYIISPGGHDYDYWESAIGFHFDFFEKRISPAE